MPSEGTQGGWRALMQVGASCRPTMDRETRGWGSQCGGCLVGLWVVRLGTQEGQAWVIWWGPRLLVDRVEGRSGTRPQVMGRRCPLRRHGQEPAGLALSAREPAGLAFSSGGAWACSSCRVVPAGWSALGRDLCCCPEAKGMWGQEEDEGTLCCPLWFLGWGQVEGQFCRKRMP